MATVGFWILREPDRRVEAPGQRDDARDERGASTGPRYWDIMRSIPAILRSDQTLRNYILASNLLGHGVTLMPFYVALGRNRAGLTTEDVGTLLLVQIVAMVASNVLWSKVAARWGFKGVVRWLILIAAAGPFAALALGTLNLTRTVFPVASGALLAALGYNAIFIAVGLVSLAALPLPLLRAMVCPVDGPEGSPSRS